MAFSSLLDKFREPVGSLVEPRSMGRPLEKACNVTRPVLVLVMTAWRSMRSAVRVIGLTPPLVMVAVLDSLLSVPPAIRLMGAAPALTAPVIARSPALVPRLIAPPLGVANVTG